MSKPKRRKKCLNCKHASVCNYFRMPDFPRWNYCNLEDVAPNGEDPREWLHETDDVCDKWESKCPYKPRKANA